ncbi:MAG: hypothetical protein DRJ31_09545 [Candidatus Methanomethylicota archaeon]|uniref:Glutamine amidotransferase type-2 domain-containing protein n=1 Tax=Thermoproteota archaeon TaxID=2056631 RepID=A0A497EKG9_9CREN|nr:MAG: hypothetical protein DRJ31_09545 [Candidatus Verstraetearchaeota archaeon]
MCGIAGCILKDGSAAPLIHKTLKRLEYRGYDCLKGDTLVQLADGSILPIKEIKPGMLLTSTKLEVLSPTGWSFAHKKLQEKPRWS